MEVLFGHWVIKTFPERILPIIEENGIIYEDCINIVLDENEEHIIEMTIDNWEGFALPQSFANLQHLKKLIINGTHIDASTFVNFLPKFSQLKKLTLSNNTFISRNNFEPEHFKNLTILYIVNGSLDIIPSNIDILIHLEKLILKGNGIMGDIPQEIGNLGKLRALIISHNKNLYGPIPDTIGQLTCLYTLDLSFNHLTGKICNSMKHLINLGGLVLCNNRLDGEIPSFIGNFVFMEFLDLRGNLFSGTIPDSIHTMPNLVYFDVGNNFLEHQIKFYHDNVFEMHGKFWETTSKKKKFWRRFGCLLNCFTLPS